MKSTIPINLIDANPHRDLKRNPLSTEQVKAVSESIQRTGFWDNLVIRPSGDRYQLAYGHNRLAALKELGITEAGFSVRDLTDYDMLNCMIDENETQQKVTPSMVFENITAALVLGEAMLNECKTVEEFNQRLKKSRGIPVYHVNDLQKNHNFFWRDNEFEKAKSQLAAGEGLGRRFIEHFLPDRKTDPNTIQAVIDSYYAESRKAAAEIKRLEHEAIAKERAEAERQAREREAAEQRAKDAAAAKAQALEDERKAKLAAAQAEENAKQRKVLEAEAKAKEAEAKAAWAERKAQDEAAEKSRKQAEKAQREKQEAEAAAAREQAQSERMDYAGIDRALLEQLPTNGHMKCVISVIKKEKIPPAWQARFVAAVLANGWTGSSDNQGGAHRPTSILHNGPIWWDQHSPERINQRETEAKKAKAAQANRRDIDFKPGDIFTGYVDVILGKHADIQRYIDTGSLPYVDKERLTKDREKLAEHLKFCQTVLNHIDSALHSNVIDITPHVTQFKQIA